VSLDGPARDAFDRIAASLDPAMAVVTTAAGDERGGCLVGFHAQSSIDPARYCVWLSKANHTYRLALRAERLAVHLLGEGDLALAEVFGTLTGDEVDKFERCGPVTERHGLPLVDALPNRIVCRRVAVLDEGGDHVCVVLEPEDAECPSPFAPLRLSRVSHLEPGHGAGERPHPPTERAER
jgi:flavin reductase (DIM6/NTAB) family NADH-FMN oxidoreductase RutF